MNIKSATFVKGVVGPEEALERNIPQVAFIGRSNVGKSSLINALTRVQNLARTSSFPGRTTEINLFLINKKMYFVDLPGYGFAKASREVRERLENLIHWYFFESGYKPKKVVHIIDANVGMTESDRVMLSNLEKSGNTILILANKVDKIKKSIYDVRMKKIQELAGKHRVIQCSIKKNIGIGVLMNEIVS